MRSNTKMVIRVLSIYFFVKFITGLPYLLSFVRQFGESTNINMSFFGFLLSHLFVLVSVIILWTYAEKISKYILDGDTTHDNIEFKTINYKQLYNIIFSVAGVFILVNSLTGMTSWILSISDFFKGMAYLEETISTGLQIIVGLFLLFKSNILTEYLTENKN